MNKLIKNIEQWANEGEDVVEYREDAPKSIARTPKW